MERKAATAQAWPIRPMPPQQAVVRLEGQFSAETLPYLRQGYIPQSPHDKWFIYYADGWLHCHRAQTGACIFQLQLLPEGDQINAPLMRVNRDPTQYRQSDDAYNVALLAYLIDHYLLGRAVPFPQPPGLSRHHHAQHQRHVIGAAPVPTRPLIQLSDLVIRSDDQLA